MLVATEDVQFFNYKYSKNVFTIYFVYFIYRIRLHVRECICRLYAIKKLCILNTHISNTTQIQFLSLLFANKSDFGTLHCNNKNWIDIRKRRTREWANVNIIVDLLCWMNLFFKCHFNKRLLEKDLLFTNKTLKLNILWIHEEYPRLWLKLEDLVEEKILFSPVFFFDRISQLLPQSRVFYIMINFFQLACALTVFFWMHLFFMLCLPTVRQITYFFNLQLYFFRTSDILHFLSRALTFLSLN